MTKPANPQYEFGPFQLNPVERLLLRGDEPVALTPKAFDTLCYFVEHSNRLLTKDELIAQLWPDSFVEESNLAQNVSAVRRALGEKPEGGHYIETVPKRGYRFAAEVKLLSPRPVARPAYVRASNQAVAFDQAAPAVDATMPAAADASYTGFDAPSIEAAREAPPTSQAPAPPQSTWLSRHALWLGVLGLVILAAASYSALRPGQFKLTADKPRLAVLPLRNLKPAAETDFLGFSLADAIITKLNYISALTVRPSAYIEKYRNQQFDPQQVAKELSVDKLLTGTYLKEDDKLVINLQLIDLASNQALWTEALNLPADKLITLQERLSKEVIQRLALTLTPAESEQLARGAPQNPLAYEYHLRGVDLYWKDELSTASKMLERSTELDANYALSWAYLGTVYTTYASLNYGGRVYYEKAQQAYDRALALAPTQIEARMFLAALLTDTGRVEQAVPLLRAVLQTNPNLAQAHWELAYAYRWGGMLKESIAAGERSRQIDNEIRANNSVFNSYLYDGQYERFLRSLPAGETSGFITFYRGLGHYYLKDSKQAASHFDRAYQLNAALMPVQAGKALSHAISGQPAAGLELLRQIEQQINESGVADAEGIYKIAQVYAVLADRASALRLLRRSIEGGFFCYPYFINDPLLEHLRNEAEYAKLIEAARQRHEAFRQRFF